MVWDVGFRYPYLPEGSLENGIVYSENALVDLTALPNLRPYLYFIFQPTFNYQTHVIINILPLSIIYNFTFVIVAKAENIPVT